MNTLRQFLAAAAFCVALIAPGLSSAADVRELRLSSGPEGTRLMVELSAAAPHKLFTLDNPQRVVIDVNDAKLLAAVPHGRGMVKQVRVGKRDRGLRIVLDVTGRVKANSAMLESGSPNGRRLVIDLVPPSSRAMVSTTTTTTAPAPAGLEEAPATAAVSVKAKHAPADTGRDLIIAIDAGHGGQDPGATGRNGTREKDVVLAIAKALRERVDREPGMRAVLVRDGDYFVILRDRMRKARAQNADLFVSIHADSIQNRNISGSSVYILSPRGASSEAARWLAERENAADLIGGVSLDDKNSVLASVLLDLSQTASLTSSMTAAEQVLIELGRIGEVRKHSIQQAGFMVLKSPDIPSMLIETAYISNPSEERRLKNSAHQDRLANAIHKGIRGYFMDNPPPGTLFAQMRAGKSSRVASEAFNDTVTQ